MDVTLVHGQRTDDGRRTECEDRARILETELAIRKNTEKLGKMPKSQEKCRKFRENPEKVRKNTEKLGKIEKSQDKQKKLGNIL